MSKRPIQDPGGAVKVSLFADEECEDKIDTLNDPLQALERLIDFNDIAAALGQITTHTQRGKGGRPAFPLEVMIRINVVQQLYNLSDEAMEFQLNDRMSFRRFCLLRNSSSVPDRTTLWSFRERIGEDGAQRIFDAVQRELTRHGYLARCGQLIDASIVSAPNQHINAEEKAIVEQNATPAEWAPSERRQRDTDARWTKKHSKSYFGYKVHVNVDKRCKFIRRLDITPANTSDTKCFEQILDPGNTSNAIYADRGYVDGEREPRLNSAGYRLHIQRKAKMGRPLSEAQKRRNRRIAKPRARVEHVFAGLSAMGGKAVRCIGLKRARIAVTLKVAVYNLKRLVSINKTGLTAF